jgi:hypothetical protein
MNYAEWLKLCLYLFLESWFLQSVVQLYLNSLSTLITQLHVCERLTLKNELLKESRIE